MARSAFLVTWILCKSFSESGEEASIRRVDTVPVDEAGSRRVDTVPGDEAGSRCMAGAPGAGGPAFHPHHLLQFSRPSSDN